MDGTAVSFYSVGDFNNYIIHQFKDLTLDFIGYI